MKLFRILALGFVLVLCTACTPLMRGVENGKLVSGAQPPLTVSCSLPLKDAGAADPFVLTDMGFQTPETWIAVYGAEDVSSPLAITAFSVAPDRMQWDFASFSPVDGPVNGEAMFGGRAFSSSLRIVDAKNDPFAPLVGAAGTGTDDERRWLAQRYTALTFFRKSKVIMEYREPLPEWLADASQLPVYDPRLEAFSRRAQDVFKVEFVYAGPPIRRSASIQGLNQRYLGRFLGSLSPIEYLFMDND